MNFALERFAVSRAVIENIALRIGQHKVVFLKHWSEEIPGALYGSRRVVVAAGLNPSCLSAGIWR
jgi:hypothetical protein